MFVAGAAALRNHSLPTFFAGPLPRTAIEQLFDVGQRRLERQLLQHRAALLNGQRADVAPVKPHDVEDVVGTRTIPGDLPVENEGVDREAGDCLGNSWNVLRQPIA